MINLRCILFGHKFICIRDEYDEKGKLWKKNNSCQHMYEVWSNKGRMWNKT